MEEKWIVYEKSDEAEGIAQTLGLDALLVQIMINRGLTQDEMAMFIGKAPSQKMDSSMLKDMDLAVEIIVDAIKNREKIRIISDYDVDGIMSNYVLLKGLQRVQDTVAKDCPSLVDYRIPHRMKDGYGMNVRLAQEAVEDGVSLIVTCDNGIAAFEAIAYAKEHGLRVVVTDHHEMQGHLPNADAIVDPKRPDSKYPFHEICGAVVAFKLIGRLYEACDIPITESNVFLPYIAMATNCDVMPLVNENRNIVKYGIAHIQRAMLSGNMDIGLQALIEANHLTADKITVGSFGFTLGPCLNAAGRLGTAEWGLKLLLETDEHRAAHRAQKLTMLNDTRKGMSDEWEQKAFRLAEQEPYCNHKVLVLYLNGCHPSIAGIVAGRVKEYTGKPTLILTKKKNSDVLSGSGRSVETYNMFEKFSEWNRFVTFGGHAMALGAGILEKDLDEFTTFINANCGLRDEDIVIKRKIDAKIQTTDISVDLVNQLARLGPYGTGNPTPRFLSDCLVLTRIQLRGAKKNVLSLEFLDENRRRIRGVSFVKDPMHFLREITGGYAGDLSTALDGTVSLHIPVKVCYSPKINSFNGMDSIELSVDALKCE